MTFKKKFLKEKTVPVFKSKTDKKVICHLLWGDQVRFDDSQDVSDGWVKVTARAKTGYIKFDTLGDESLLEVYFIDVGQGDGILIKTPEGKHIMIDGGYKRKSQQSGKNAADFIDWKFSKDYGMKTMELDAMIASHNDADHYGGLWDLINPKEEHELTIKTADIHVKKFYHSGVAWFKNAGKRSLGPVKEKNLLFWLRIYPI